jgi:hypothetical protein
VLGFWSHGLIFSQAVLGRLRRGHRRLGLPEREQVGPANPCSAAWTRTVSSPAAAATYPRCALELDDFLALIAG